ncbi:MAG: hypothetical protein R3Y63_11690 [Eubacteriales bacterium]
MKKFQNICHIGGTPIISIFTKAKEQENLALRKELEKVEIENVRLGIQNKSLIQEQEGNVQKLANQKEEIQRLSAEMEERNSKLLSLELEHHHLQIEHQCLIKKLESTPPKKHNERGAGRKQSISTFHIRHVMYQLNKGKSAREISENLIPQTDSSWRVEKVRYVIKRYLDQKEDGQWELLQGERS